MLQQLTVLAKHASLADPKIRIPTGCRGGVRCRPGRSCHHHSIHSLVTCCHLALALPKHEMDRNGCWSNGFLKWRIPKKTWASIQKSHSWMIWYDLGVPRFRKTPIGPMACGIQPLKTPVGCPWLWHRKSESERKVDLKKLWSIWFGHNQLISPLVI